MCLQYIPCDFGFNEVVLCSTKNADQVSTPDTLTSLPGNTPWHFAWLRFVRKVVTHGIPENPARGTNVRSCWWRKYMVSINSLMTIGNYQQNVYIKSITSCNQYLVAILGWKFNTGLYEQPLRLITTKSITGLSRCYNTNITPMTILTETVKDLTLCSFNWSGWQSCWWRVIRCCNKRNSHYMQSNI